jgi:lysine 2,3-aminomutase
MFSKNSPKNFPELWPKGYRRLAESSEPLLLAGTTATDEAEPDAEALADPTGERDLAPFPHLLRKHRNRALLLVTGKCHFHCRFCFRRGAPADAKGELTPEKLEDACRWLAGERDIEEVILSGGDPLTLSNEALSGLLARLGRIEGIKRLRIHTRAPVTVPERIDAGLISALAEAPRPVRLVLHPVHPDEFRPALFAALRRLRRRGIELSSQGVLLRGVNDNAETLYRLFRGLLDAEVTPRYLHHPDRAPGNAKFRLTIRNGLLTYGKLRELAATNNCPAAVPPYVLDLPNGAGKCPVETLVPVAAQTGGDRRRVRYRWVRPQRWDGVSEAKRFEWWDIREGL